MGDLRDRLVERLQKLGIEERPWPGRDDGFSSLFYEGKELAHFHSRSELDLRLGREVIKREGLVHPSGSQVHPKRAKTSPWIEVRFSKPEDLEHVVRLVALAIERT